MFSANLLWIFLYLALRKEKHYFCSVFLHYCSKIIKLKFKIKLLHHIEKLNNNSLVGNG